MSDPPPALGPGDASATAEERDPEIAALVRRVAAADPASASLREPLPDATVDRIVQTALDKARAPRAPTVSKARPPSRARWMVLAAAATLTLAAAAAGFAWFGADHRGSHRIAYVLELRGDAEKRSDDPPGQGPIHLRPDTRLRARIAPISPVRDKQLRVLVVRAGKSTLIEHIQYSIAADGAVTLEAPARELLGEQPNGPADLVFVVGRQVPGDDEVRSLAQDPSREPNGDFDVLRRAVLFEGWGATGLLLPGDIEFAGCESVTTAPLCEGVARRGALTGRACEIAPGDKLRLWAPGETTALSFRVGDHALTAPSEKVAVGVRFTLDAPAETGHLHILGPSGEIIDCIALRASIETEALREARRLMKKNDLEAARKRLLEADGDPRPEVRLLARRLLARVVRRGGDRARMLTLLEGTIAEDRAQGRLSYEIEDRHLRAHHHITRDVDFAAARQDLTLARALEIYSPEHRADGDYHRALLAGETGQLEEEQLALRAALRRAARLGTEDVAVAARSRLLDALALLGRHEEAKSLVDASLSAARSSPDPCLQARLVTTAAWALLRGAESKEAVQNAAISAADAVNTAREKCGSDLPNALLNLAFSELGAGKASIARETLAEARRLVEPDDVRFASWASALDIELALSGRPEEALSAFTDLARRGEMALSPELVFRAAEGKARALDALNRTGDALSAYEEADRALERWSALVPLGEGRESFFWEQRRFARAAVDFHVRRAEKAPSGPARDEAIRAAAAAARRSFARYFDVAAGGSPVTDERRSEYAKIRKEAGASTKGGQPISGPAERALRDAQRLAGEGLPWDDTATDPRACSLVYHEIEGGFVGFAEGPGAAVSMARLPSSIRRAIDEEESADPLKGPPDPALAALLTPFEDQIAAASRARVPGQGPFRSVRFGALPFRGVVLSRSVPVVHGLDMNPRPPRADLDVCSGGRRALVVTEPTSDLAGAQATAPLVKATLQKNGFEIDSLVGQDATRDAVIARLRDPCTGMFHYDGHGRHKDAGLDGLGEALTLQGASITARDVLELPRVPEEVVLLGCGTARASGMGLAQAFIARGAREVLATTNDVEDALARRVVTGLYSSERAPSTPDLAASLSAALRPLERETDALSLFRVIAR